MTMRVLSAAVGILFVTTRTVANAIEQELCRVPGSCVDDKYKAVFASTGTSELLNVAVGQEIEVHLLLDVKSSPVQGFSYGVPHDTAVLEILSATHQGAADVIAQAEFKTTKVTQDKLGFYQAVVITLDDQPPFELPLGDNLHLATATYKVLAAPEEGSTICVSDAFFPRGSWEPPNSITIAGIKKRPKTVECAVLTGAATLPNFSRGDANGDSAISLTDAIVVVQNIFLGKLVLFDCEDMLDVNDDGRLDTSDPVFLLNHLFRRGEQLPFPFKSCGPDIESDALRCKQPNCR